MNESVCLCEWIWMNEQPRAAAAGGLRRSQNFFEHPYLVARRRAYFRSFSPQFWVNEQWMNHSFTHSLKIHEHIHWTLNECRPLLKPLSHDAEDFREVCLRVTLAHANTGHIYVLGRVQCTTWWISRNHARYTCSTNHRLACCTGMTPRISMMVWNGSFLLVTRIWKKWMQLQWCLLDTAHIYAGHEQPLQPRLPVPCW